MPAILNDKLRELLEFKEFSYLKIYQKEIKRTFEALGLVSGERYTSIGIGTNRVPSLFALHGLDVIGFDIDEESIRYQRSIISNLSPAFEEANGHLRVYNWNVDENPREIYIHSFNVVECVNFTRKYESRELAQILLGLGKKESSYLVSLFGGRGGKENALVQAVIAEVGRRDKKHEVIADDLFVSDRYLSLRAALLMVY